MASGMGWAVCGLAALALSACARPLDGPKVLSDKQVLAALNQRGGAHACCFYQGKDATGRPIYGQLNGARQLRFVVRSQLGSEAIACGWSGFAAPRDAKGRAMAAGPDRIFIVRNGRVYLQEDVSADTFERWQAELCGPAWVKPRMVGGAS